MGRGLRGGLARHSVDDLVLSPCRTVEDCPGVLTSALEGKLTDARAMVAGHFGSSMALRLVVLKRL